MRPSGIDSAFKAVHLFFRREFEVFFSLQSFNRGRHCLFKPPVTRSDISSFYVLFKNDFFFDFEKFFPAFKGAGESINVDFLKSALAAKAEFLVFVYKSGQVYRVKTKDVASFCVENDTVRTQDVINDSKSLVRETTYSFPVSLLKFWGELL